MKKFGLDIKSKEIKKIKKLSVFNDSSSDDDNDDDDEKVKIPTLSFSSSFKKQDTSKLEKAIEEDPTIYEYDSLHDQISTAKAKVQVSDDKINNSKLSKLFLESAQKKNLRYQVVLSKKARKENEIDKTEVFVSNSYKKEQEKILALDKADQEQAKREEILAAARGRGASAIYRYMLNEKLTPPTKHTSTSRPDSSADETEPAQPDPAHRQDPVVEPPVKERSPEEDEIVKSAIKSKMIREKASLLMKKPDTKQVASKFVKKNDEISTDEARNRYLCRKKTVKRCIVEEDSD